MSSSDFNKRKKPRQERARHTVDMIAEAARRIISERGFKALTTNHVAELAGVSVGSLYQYFPNKHAIVREVFDRHRQQVAKVAAELVVEAQSLSLKDAIYRAMEIFAGPHLSTILFHKMLVTELNTYFTLEERKESIDRLIAGAEAWLKSRGDEVKRQDLALAAELVVQMMAGSIQGALEYRPHRLEEPAFVSEVTDMIYNYLVM